MLLAGCLEQVPGLGPDPRTVIRENEAKAIGMLNLDSLITGDFMYANAGDLSYDSATNQSVPKYSKSVCFIDD